MRMGTLQSTVINGLTIYHTVPTLGPDVARQVAAAIRLYQDRAGLPELPPISLMGDKWDLPWTVLATYQSCRGNSGSWDNRERCLSVEVEKGNEPPDPGTEVDPCRRTIDRVIAHEIVHLRWPRLRHGLKFFTRLLALLRGATFPTSGSGWSKQTRQMVIQAQQDVLEHFRQTYGGPKEEERI